MAWYAGATKYELQPESDSQPAIRPTQFIVHSIIAPWTAKRTYEYWRDSTNLESHFGLGYEGDLGQFIGTETRADANYNANRRPDGTGAVSIETASNTKGTDPWTEPQIEKLIELGVWLHKRHGIPLRICRTGSDPGFGYHRLHPDWSPSGTACPGDARVRQFTERVFPQIVARATGTTAPPPEEDVPLTAQEKKDIAAEVAKLLLRTDGQYRAPKDAADWSPDPADSRHWWSGTTVYDVLVSTVRETADAVDALSAVELTDAQVTAIADKVATHPTLAERIAEHVAAKLADRLAN